MDIGIQEIMLISVIALIVLGPERLPVAVRTIAIWVNRFRRSFNDMRRAIEEEVNADDIRRQIHNENILHELGETRQALTDLEQQLQAPVSESNLDTDSKPEPPTESRPSSQ